MQPDPYERFWQQFDEVHAKQPGKTYRVWPPEAQPYSGVPPEYVYEAGRMLCRTEHVDQVRSQLDALDATYATVDPELTVITVPVDVDIPTNVRAINTATGQQREAYLRLNHLVSISPVNLCPADEPVPVAVDAQPWPPRVPDMSVGAGIEILVIDTGMPADFLDNHPWLAGVQVPPPDQRIHFLRDPTEPVPGRPGAERIKEYAGHGMFIAGVLGSVAPGAKIHVSNALQNGGALPETELGAVLLEALGALPHWPHIISLSAGCPTMDGQPLLGLDGFLAELARHPETGIY